jgi:hypothetical protein
MIVKTPFHDESGNIKFPYRAILDRVFIYPIPPPEKLGKQGLIVIPKQHQGYHQDRTGIILSIGPGYEGKRVKWCPTAPELKPGVRVMYDVSVPWKTIVKGLDGKNYVIPVCGTADIMGVVKDE